jgi:hypothetical protein
VEGDSLWKGTAGDIGQPNGQDNPIVRALINSVLTTWGLSTLAIASRRLSRHEHKVPGSN